MMRIDRAPAPTMARSNADWLRALGGAPDLRDAAISDLCAHLQRGLYWYLARERSDLAARSPAELQQMAEDYAQNAVLRVLQRLDTFRGESRFTTWATRIALRIAISDLRRARYRDFRLDDLTAEGELSLLQGTTLPGNGYAPTPETDAERAEVEERILRALREDLTPRQRQALEAVVLQGVPLEIVAQQMGSNRNALYKLVHDARRKLRARLEAQGLEPGYMLGLFA